MASCQRCSVDDRISDWGNNGLSHALSLIQNIQDQITLHDSPPVNEEIAQFFQKQQLQRTIHHLQFKRNGDVKSGSVSGYNSTTQNREALPDFNRQRHVLNFSPLSTPSTSPTNLTVSDKDRQVYDNYQENCSPNSNSMGMECLSFPSVGSPIKAGLSVLPQHLESRQIDDNFIHLHESTESKDEALKNKMNKMVRKAEYTMGNMSLAALCERTSAAIEQHLKTTPLDIYNPNYEPHCNRPAENYDTNAMTMSRDESTDSVSTEHVVNASPRKVLMEKEREMAVAELDFLFNSSFFTNEDHGDRKEITRLEKRTSAISFKRSDDPSDPYGYLETDHHVMGSEKEIVRLNASLDSGDCSHEQTDTIPVFQPSLDAAKSAEDESRSSNNRDLNHRRGKLPPLSPAQSFQSATGLHQPYHPRLQMFGSEYARLISTLSHFSPVQSKVVTKGIKTPIIRRTRMSLEPSSLLMSVGSPPRQKFGLSDQSQPSQQNVSVRSNNASRPGSTCSYESSDGSSQQFWNIEDADDSILSGAITDIVITHGSEPPPQGYFRISKTSNGLDVDLIKNMTVTGVSSLVGGKKNSSVWINIKKEANWERAVQRPCVTALAVIFPDRNEFVPPGFSVVRRYKVSSLTGMGMSEKDLESNKNDKDNGVFGNSQSIPANLNFGTNGERVFLCYRRSREGNPITGLIPLSPTNNETIPEGYSVIEKSPRNFVADINSKAGPPLFLAVRQRLSNLETLRPLPLVISVCYSNLDQFEATRINKRNLRAYYCTGGTIVPSNVGRYHIMDRSTHMMLSASSVRSRLNVIEASRLKRSSTSSTGSGVPASVKVEQNYQDYLIHSVPTINSHGAHESFPKVEVNSSRNVSGNESFIDFENEFVPLAFSSSNEVQTNDSCIDSPISNYETSEFNRDILLSCLDALSSIPSIVSGGTSDSLSLEHGRITQLLLQTRIAALTPVLTACYTLHGGSAFVAVEGLTTLLINTDFFLTDVEEHDGIDYCDRLTLLDLSIQVVCDVGNCTSRETYFSSCVEFVSKAVSYSKGNLNSRTLGYILRFYLFVFYFGSSVPNNSGWPHVSAKEAHEIRDVLILSEEDIVRAANDSTVGRSYIPGGAPQASALALKDLLSLLVVRIHKLPFQNQCSTERLRDKKEEICDFVKNVVGSMVDCAVDRVDMANYTQLALHQILKSGGSELFWHDMISTCGIGLFASDGQMIAPIQNYFISLFSVLATIVKASSGSLRKLANTTQLVPRDVSSKYLSLELIQHFLDVLHESLISSLNLTSDGLLQKSSLGCARDVKRRSFATIAYAIRRLIVPSLLENTKHGIEDVRVFRRMLKIVSELWCKPFYREHLKIEIGVLIEHFFLKILRLGPQLLPPKRLCQGTQTSILDEMNFSLLPHQVAILTEVKIWFSHEPRDVLELFLNFDEVDAASSQNHVRLLPSRHWNITEQLCSSICTLSEQCTEIVSEQIRLTRVDLACMDSSSSVNNVGSTWTQEDWREMTSVREGARFLQEKCFEAVGQIVRSLMLCAAASSGANYDLLVTLRERRLRTNDSNEDTSRIQLDNITGIQSHGVPTESESDDEFDDSMSLKSISTIGNIVGGMQMKREAITPSSGSPTRMARPFSPIPSPNRSNTNNEHGIVEYWHTSIAAERKRHLSLSPSDRNRQFFPEHMTAGTTIQSSRIRRASGSLPPTIPPAGSSKKTNTDTIISKEAEISSAALNNEEKRKSKSLKTEDVLNIAFEIISTKGLKKALDYLFACNFLTHSPRDIASFLRLYQSKIDHEVLGDYLGEGGRDGADVEHFNLIRFFYTRAISFVNMTIEQGLRHFLTNCGFRLPGEAQKIDRIMTTFAQCYWEDNAGDNVKCPFFDEDTVFLISFAIIMLNTDLHKTNNNQGSTVLRSKQKLRKKMTKAEFLTNLRGVDNSIDLARDYLSNIYDSIATFPIQIHEVTHPSSTDQCSERNSLNLRYGGDVRLTIDSSHSELVDMILEIHRSVKLSQELLRGLAVHEHPYLTLRNYKKKTKRSSIPGHLVLSAFSAMWHHFHSVINSALDSAHLNPKGLEDCLDVLKYSLCASICLDLNVERNAFAIQLVRVKCFRENRGLEDDRTPTHHKRRCDRTRDHLDYKNDTWYRRIVNIQGTILNAKVAALDEVDDMFFKLHSSLKVDTKLKKEMVRVARQIRNGQILLNDPTRYFIRQSELMKKCKRTGRYNRYNFYLFSDLLVYAHKSAKGDYKIHEELPLHLMKIVDAKSMGGVNHQKILRTFSIIHPRKSFLVMAGSAEDKSVWVQTINVAISREVRRKARIEGARQAAAFER